MNLPNFSSNPRSNTILWIVVAAVAILAGGVLIGAFTPAVLPPAASAEGQQVDDLFRFMLVIGGSIFLLVNGVLVYSIVRYRARPGDRSDGVPLSGNSTLEFTWTIIPTIIVLILTVYSWQVYTNITSVNPNERVIEVVGQRFAFAFNYDITLNDLPDGVTQDQLPENIRATFDAGDAVRFSSAQLHTWVGQPMLMQMRTEDVNHAFWIPAMRVKQDMLAGRQTEVRFTPTEAGVYRIVCAELCGSGHGAMAGEVNVSGDLIGAWLIVHQDEATYQREFFAPNAQQALFPPEDPALLGRQILASNRYPCAACHVVTDLGWNGVTGPNLNNVGNRAATRVAGQSAHDYLYESIRLPGAYLVPGYGNLMPQFNPEPDQPNYMPEEDLEAIIAYLLTLAEN